MPMPPLLDKLLKRFRRDNGVAPGVETSPYVNAEGLEDKIVVPAPTKEDRRWARKVKDATADGVTQAMQAAIAEGRNWRVWYLLNRPLKSAKEFYVGARKKLGFDGAAAVGEGLEKAAQHNNVTAAYLLLKYAEKNAAILAPQAGPEAEHDPVRAQVSHYAMAALQNAAAKPGSDVFALLAQTFSTLNDREMHPAAPHAIVDYQAMLKQAAVKAGAQGNEGHLDAMLKNGLLTPLQLVEAFMGTLDVSGERPVTPQERKGFLDWLASRGIVDQVFADEAAMVETRIEDARRLRDGALQKGWKVSTRDLPLQDGSIQKAGERQAEIAIGSEREAGITYVFNYSAERAHRIRGAVAQEIPRAQVDAQLKEEGRQFLDSLQTEAPALEWKKGEPFRLRFQHAPRT